MIENKIKELQKILDNAPEGATHIDEEGYLMFSCGDYHFRTRQDNWQMCDYEESPILEIRSLSDIKLIVAALKYINECPCDPDIYTEQLTAWNDLQGLL